MKNTFFAALFFGGCLGSVYPSTLQASLDFLYETACVSEQERNVPSLNLEEEISKIYESDLRGYPPKRHYIANNCTPETVEEVEEVRFLIFTYSKQKLLISKKNGKKSFIVEGVHSLPSSFLKWSPRRNTSWQLITRSKPSAIENGWTVYEWKKDDSESHFFGVYYKERNDLWSEF